MPNDATEIQHAYFWEDIGTNYEATRKISDFAQNEIIIPNGPYAGQYFSVETQPYVRLYFDAIESGQYQRFAVVGPTQSGKTLSASVIPTLYSLFECCDDVVFGAPTIDIAKDKWQKDFSPVISRTRYASLMPTHGTGARGGSPSGINFGNGASLRFMTGGSGDKGVAGYTARVIAVTEVDGMDEASESSREADRISQLEVRGDAFGLSKRVYLECTASIITGRIWQEYIGGTHTEIIKTCPYCDMDVIPEREHIKGWDVAANERAAVTESYFVCPACEHPLSSSDRIDMVHGCNARVNNPDSMTYSFRWNAFDNLFWTPGEIGLDEYRAAHRPGHEKEDATKVQLQFKWAVPFEPDEEATENVIDLDSVEPHTTPALMRSVVPSWAEYLTFGCDVGAKRLHWVIIAWRQDGTSHVVDYGEVGNPYKDYGQEEAVRRGLLELRAFLANDWQQSGPGAARKIDGGLIDAGWLPEIVRDICVPPILSAVGVGATNNFRKLQRPYRKPRATGSEIRQIGEAWHLIRRKPTKGGARYNVIEHDVDYGKTWLHRRLATPDDRPGTMTMFSTIDPKGHDAVWRQLTAEQQIIKNGVMTWAKKRDRNHWLDAFVLACTAARMLGVEVQSETEETEAPPQRAIEGEREKPMTQREKRRAARNQAR